MTINNDDIIDDEDILNSEDTTNNECVQSNDISTDSSNNYNNINELIENDYIIILDTNVYLGLYRFSPDYSNFALECLEKVKNNIRIPYTVSIEYNKHNRSLYQKRQDAIRNSSTNTMDLINIQRNKLRNSCATLNTLHFPEIDNLLLEINETYDGLANMMTNYFEDRSVLTLIQNDSWTSDKVNNLISELVNNNQIMEDFDREEIYQICEEGLNRYKREIPPGYKDAKNKDGIAKYSDLILWKEIIKFAREERRNIIFVTDDVKRDWWNIENDTYTFLPQLIQEFTSQTRILAQENDNMSSSLLHIVPFVSSDFYEAISHSMSVPRSDIVDQALQITNTGYIDSVKDIVFNHIENELRYSELNYIKNTTMPIIGSEGITEWLFDEYELDSFQLLEREDDQIVYELIYNIKMQGNSYDYFGSYGEIENELYSSPYIHRVQGQIAVEIIRSVDIFMDFEYSDEFDSAQITYGNFEQIDFTHCWETEQKNIKDAYNTCPDCGNPINFDNDGGNGFCLGCASNH